MRLVVCVYSVLCVCYTIVADGGVVIVVVICVNVVTVVVSYVIVVGVAAIVIVGRWLCCLCYRRCWC